MLEKHTTEAIRTGNNIVAKGKRSLRHKKNLRVNKRRCNLGHVI
jgi:hypothetical protein